MKIKKDAGKEDAIVVFQDMKVRRIWHNNEWYFSVVDVVGVLTDSIDARKYWNKLSQRLREEGSEVVTDCHQLKLMASDSKYYPTDCANTEAIFRIIQSVPSKKAEPFKLWLAEVGHDRIKEIQDPELAQDRARKYYELKGYPKGWIEKRLRGIAVRQDLTREWKEREVGEGREFAILTNEISKAAFGKTVGEYKKFKGLSEHNLRDHMTDLELIFTMLGERVTTEITSNKDSRGFPQCRTAARKGGNVAGRARKDAEKQIGRPVITKKNYLSMGDEKQRIARKRSKLSKEGKK